MIQNAMLIIQEENLPMTPGSTPGSTPGRRTPVRRSLNKQRSIPVKVVRHTLNEPKTLRKSTKVNR